MELKKEAALERPHNIPGQHPSLCATPRGVAQIQARSGRWGITMGAFLFESPNHLLLFPRQITAVSSGSSAVGAIRLCVIQGQPVSHRSGGDLQLDRSMPGEL